MKRYFLIYKTLLRLNFTTLIEYRLNFLNSIIASITWGLMSFLYIYLLTARTSSVYDWKKEELLLLTGLYNVIIGVFHMLFSRNFERFARIIFLGQLDSILVKPADSQFLLSFWFINYTSISRIILGIFFTAFLIYQYNIPVNFLSLISFCFFLILGVSITYGMWFLFMPFTIWFPRLSNLVEFLYQVNGLARYPREMIQQGVFLLFFFPIFFVVATPAKIFLQKATFFDIITPLFFACGLIIISRKFWRYALRFYTSASS